VFFLVSFVFGLDSLVSTFENFFFFVANANKLGCLPLTFF
jgi:hypothetical protein